MENAVEFAFTFHSRRDNRPGTVAARLIDFHFGSKPALTACRSEKTGNRRAGDALMTVRFCLPIKGDQNGRRRDHKLLEGI
jgi:hypothetical protein